MEKGTEKRVSLNRKWKERYWLKHQGEPPLNYSSNKVPIKATKMNEMFKARNRFCLVKRKAQIKCMTSFDFHNLLDTRTLMTQFVTIQWLFFHNVWSVLRKTNSASGVIQIFEDGSRFVPQFYFIRTVYDRFRRFFRRKGRSFF